MRSGYGMPIGNITSQIFSNIYLNELDQFVKHKLRVKNYFRYADDFIIVHENRDYLAGLIGPVQKFLRAELQLALHPGKVEIRKLKQGIDFLGYVTLPYHIIMRTKTKQRMFRKLFEKQVLLQQQLISREHYQQSLQSYLGILMHCNGYDLGNVLQNNFLL